MYKRQIQDHDITFGIGPAGTGKTYLAVASAVDAMTRDRVKRIVLVRPAVAVSYTHLDVYKRQDDISLFSPLGGQVASIKKTATQVTLVDEMCIRDRARRASKKVVL